MTRQDHYLSADTILRDMVTQPTQTDRTVALLTAAMHLAAANGNYVGSARLSASYHAEDPN
jgi:hypothetical protein